ncbi:TonB-dependent receptor [Novosphingobium naphthalenivorans]|uniref:TonB-dependent receptor n=1 Tax=Novosphingobium naphthalenivorans TaxID=273168 RepID=UPI0008360CC9|nr:TonB-dependent receptor [Novosphingobium naphthalenivorans]
MHYRNNPAPERAASCRRLARVLKYAGLIGALGLVLPGAAMAEDNENGTGSVSANGTGSVSANGAIVVTAQKRTENVLDVPVSISVIDSSLIKKTHATDYTDLSRLVPGLSLNNFGNSGMTRIALRGIASSSGSATVGVYLDDVSLTFPNQFFTGATLPRMFDIERIEVLRGPQGTLYGDSSLGGTLRFITNKPKLGYAEGEASGEVSSTEGGGTNYKLNGAISVPLGQHAALRIAGETGYQSGFIDRVDSSGNVIDKNIDSERHHAVRASLLWEPSDDLQIIPAIQYQLVKTADNSIFNLSLPRFQVNKALTEPSRDELVVPSLTIEKSFGDYRLTSVTSYMHRNFKRRFDATIYDSEYVAWAIDPSFGTPYDTIASLPGALLNDDKISNWVEELRFASPSIEQGHRFEWQAGLYMNSLKVRSLDDEYVYGLNDAVANLYSDTTVEDLIGYEAPDDLLGYFHSNRKLQQIAAFAEGSVMLAPSLKFTAGLRQTKAWTEYEMNEGGWLADGTPSYEKVKSNESPLTPKFALNYKASDNVSLYASATKGFRLGGQNNSLPNYCASSIESLGLDATKSKSYGSDSLWAFETGFKSSLFGNRLTVNGSVYRIDWKNIQQQLRLSSCGYVITANAGDARSQGGELEVMAKLTNELSLRATAGYTDAEITKEAEGSSASKGQKVLGVPDTTLTLGLDYNRQISDDLAFSFSTNWTYTGKSHGSFSTSSSDYVREDYWVGNLDAGIDYRDFRLSVFVKNIANDQTVIQKPSVLFITQGLTVRPRTIGLSLAKTF